MKLAELVKDWRIYELDEKECKVWYREYPCFVCWEEKRGTCNHDIGNLYTTENESGTLEEMIAWCEKN
jgi:hypothetical protein